MQETGRLLVHADGEELTAPENPFDSARAPADPLDPVRTLQSDASE